MMNIINLLTYDPIPRLSSAIERFLVTVYIKIQISLTFRHVHLEENVVIVFDNFSSVYVICYIKVREVK